MLSALDISVQADILDLLRTLQSEHKIAYLFISHDLAVVRSIAHRVGVLYRGELVEVGEVAEVYSPPIHPYTHMLLSAVPEIGVEHEHSTALLIDATPTQAKSKPPVRLRTAARGSWASFVRTFFRRGGRPVQRISSAVIFRSATCRH